MEKSINPEKSTSLLNNRNYLLLWFGQSFSLIGDYFFVATIATWIISRLAVGESWLPLAAGGVAVSAALPPLLISPLAGVQVDRWNRKWTMVWTDIIRLGVVLLFLVLVLLVSDRLILLVSCFAVLLLVEAGSQFFLPARVAVVADIVPSQHHPMAYGSLQQASYFAQIVGPAVAVPLFLVLGPAWAIILNALSFLVSALFLLALVVPAEEKIEQKERVGFWREFGEGLRFFLGNRILVTLLLSGMIFMFAGMAYNSFEYLYGVENLHIDGPLLGLYVATFGIGVVIGLPIVALLAKRFSEVEVLWLALICYGIVTLILSRVTSLIPGMICGLLLGFCSSSIFVVVSPLRVLVTPRDLLGRVIAFEVPMIMVASLLGAFVASTLASTVLSDLHVTIAGMTFRRLDTIFVGVGIVTIGAGIFVRCTLYKAVKEFRAKKVLEEEATIEDNDR